MLCSQWIKAAQSRTLGSGDRINLGVETICTEKTSKMNNPLDLITIVAGVIISHQHRHYSLFAHRGRAPEGNQQNKGPMLRWDAGKFVQSEMWVRKK